MTWQLPERVKRLSVNSYHYNPHDLKFFDIYVLETDGKVLGVLALDNVGDTEGTISQPGILIHGIYIDVNVQKQGLGAQLINFTGHLAQDKAVKGILVKAQTDANEFFKSQGFEPLPVSDTLRDYSNRWWKALSRA